MRIAYVVHTFDIGGMERCVSRLVNHLDRSRFHPTLICLDHAGAATAWIEAADVPIVELRKRPGNDPRVVPRLARALKKRGIDLVHSNNWGTLVETVLARRLSAVPLHVHAERGTVLGDLQLSAWRRRLRGLASRWAIEQADAVVAVTDSVRQRLVAESGLSPRRVHVIPNGVDVSRDTAAGARRRGIRRSLGIDEHAFLVGSVGRLVPVKDLGTAIDALSRLVARGRDAHLVLVGDGPERRSLADRSEAAGVANRVHLVGQRLDVGTWLDAMDVYVNSSLSEGMSQAILEAMAEGVPAVVTNVGESAAVVSGGPKNLVVPPADAGALADALDKILTTGTREARGNGSAAPRMANVYTTTQMMADYHALYARIAAC